MRKFWCSILRTPVLFCFFIVFSWFYFGGSYDSIESFVIETIASAEEEPEGASITKFKVEPLHRAVRVTWKVKKNVKDSMTFEIHRSMASPDQPYALVTSLEGKPGMKKYKYIDKQLPVEENYFYKIVIPETSEIVGPLQVRPPFSLPTT